MANLGTQAGSGFDASDLTTGTLGNTVQDNITRLGTVTTGTMKNTIHSDTTFPAGHVIQTVTNEDTDGTSASGNSSSNATSPVWTDVVSVNITPSSGTKCICFVDAILGSAATSNSGYMWARVLRDSTTLGASDLSSYDWPSMQSPIGTDLVFQYSRSAYDAHGADGSTQITYKFQISNQHSSYAIYAGRNGGTVDTSYGSAQSSRIIVMEVK
tara:strand:- start:553 stop:1191 length:639 start_codon:yes stop_codon:yes gene_type:complete